MVAPCFRTSPCRPIPSVIMGGGGGGGVERGGGEGGGGAGVGEAGGERGSGGRSYVHTNTALDSCLVTDGKILYINRTRIFLLTF